jgi:hypothetical protein
MSAIAFDPASPLFGLVDEDCGPHFRILATPPDLYGRSSTRVMFDLRRGTVRLIETAPSGFVNRVTEFEQDPGLALRPGDRTPVRAEALMAAE